MTKPRVWSLLDIMRHFDLWRLCNSMDFLHGWEAIAEENSKRLGADSPMTDDGLAMVRDIVQQLKTCCQRIELKATIARIETVLFMELHAHGTPTWGKLASELLVLRQTIIPELLDHEFAVVQQSKTIHLRELFGNPRGRTPLLREGNALVWAAIVKRFPSTKYDCEEAVFCYVLERNTACVFHSMRIAEIGLRALARKMRVTLKGRKKLEWANWLEVLKEMKKKTDAMGEMKAGPAKDELLEFYNGAIAGFYGFKDEFRNQVMHVRETYDEFASAKALNHVRDFMGKLAEKIDEKGKVAK